MANLQSSLSDSSVQGAGLPSAEAVPMMRWICATAAPGMPVCMSTLPLLVAYPNYSPTAALAQTNAACRPAFSTSTGAGGWKVRGRGLVFQ
jgi:hypothetical protein